MEINTLLLLLEELTVQFCLSRNIILSYPSRQGK
jgi:hypothetical protein